MMKTSGQEEADRAIVGTNSVIVLEVRRKWKN